MFQIEVAGEMAVRQRGVERVLALQAPFSTLELQGEIAKGMGHWWVLVILCRCWHATTSSALEDKRFLLEFRDETERSVSG